MIVWGWGYRVYVEVGGQHAESLLSFRHVSPRCWVPGVELSCPLVGSQHISPLNPLSSFWILQTVKCWKFLVMFHILLKSHLHLMEEEHSLKIFHTLFQIWKTRQTLRGTVAGLIMRTVFLLWPGGCFAAFVCIRTRKCLHIHTSCSENKDTERGCLVVLRLVLETWLGMKKWQILTWQTYMWKSQDRVSCAHSDGGGTRYNAQKLLCLAQGELS